MKKVLTKILVAVVAVFVFASCNLTLPVTASSAPIGAKKGTSTTLVVFGAINVNQKYGLEEAIKNGKITGGIAIIDEKISNYVFFSKKELFIYGE